MSPVGPVVAGRDVLRADQTRPRLCRIRRRRSCFYFNSAIPMFILPPIENTAYLVAHRGTALLRTSRTK